MREGLRGARSIALLLVLVAFVAACADDAVPTPPSSGGLATVAPPSLASGQASPLSSLGPPPNGSAPAASVPAGSDVPLGTLPPPASVAPSDGSSAAPTGIATPSPTPFVPPTPTPVPSIANGIDPCALVTQPELEGIAGHPVLATTRLGTAVRPVGCRWEFESGTAGQPFELTLGVTSPGGAQAFASAKAFTAEGTPLPSLGQGAFSVVGNTIFVIQGDTMLDAQYLASETEQNRFTVPVAVLQQALTRLPPS